MATKAGFKGGAKKSDATPRKPAATVPTTAPKVRRVASQDESFSRSLAAKIGDGTVEMAEEDLVDVNVPHRYTLTDDDHLMHVYMPGEQQMRKSHAEHPYSKANGVTVLS